MNFKTDIGLQYIGSGMAMSGEPFVGAFSWHRKYNMMYNFKHKNCERRINCPLTGAEKIGILSSDIITACFNTFYTSLSHFMLKIDVEIIQCHQFHSIKLKIYSEY